MKFPSLSRLRTGLVLALLVLVSQGTNAAEEAPAITPMDVVCRVNGVEILRRDVEGRKQQLLPWGSFHGNVDPEKQQVFRRQALQELIDDDLAYQDAKRRGINVTKGEMKPELDRIIARFPNKKTFRKQLKHDGIKFSKVEDAVRRKVTIEKVKKEVADVERPVSDEEVKAYYEENLRRFERPRQAVVRRIFVPVAPLERTPEDWKAAIERARAAKARVEAGEPFDAVAEQVSGVPEAEKEQGGLVGTVHPGQLDQKLDEALWEIPEGGMSEPIATFKGVTVLKVDHFIPAHQLTFEEIEKNLIPYLQKEQSKVRVESWSKALREQAKIEILDPALAPE